MPLKFFAPKKQLNAIKIKGFGENLAPKRTLEQEYTCDDSVILDGPAGLSVGEPSRTVLLEPKGVIPVHSCTRALESGALHAGAEDDRCLDRTKLRLCYKCENYPIEEMCYLA